MSQKRKPSKFTSEQAESLKKEYADMRLLYGADDCLEKLAEKYSCGKSTIFKNIRTSVSIRKYVQTEKPRSRLADKVENLDRLAIVIKKAKKIFNDIQIGDKLILGYRNKSVNEKSYADSLRPCEGIVYHKNSNVIFVRHEVFKHRTNDIKLNDLICREVKVEVMV